MQLCNLLGDFPNKKVENIARSAVVGSVQKRRRVLVFWHLTKAVKQPLQALRVQSACKDRTSHHRRNSAGTYSRNKKKKDKKKKDKPSRREEEQQPSDEAALANK